MAGLMNAAGNTFEISTVALSVIIVTLSTSCVNEMSSCKADAGAAANRIDAENSVAMVTRTTSDQCVVMQSTYPSGVK